VSEFSNRPVDFRLNFVGHDRYISLYERNGFEWETEVIEAPAEQRRNSSDYEPV
jgi:hypothetical protein